LICIENRDILDSTDIRKRTTNQEISEMITNVKKQQNLMFATVSGEAVKLAEQAKGHKHGRQYYFWYTEWKAFLALARKAKIEVQR
jgi:hypothetical protein